MPPHVALLRPAMRNKLYVGFNREIELPNDGFLLLDDEIRPTKLTTRVFDPKKDSFNPMRGMNHRKARELSDLLYTIYPQGDNTLTVRNGRRALPPALLKAKRLDQVEGDEEIAGMIDDLLFSPVLKRVLCSPTNFSFKPGSTIMARLNRAELGEFDALVLGFFLMAQFKGQVVVPDFGFYGRDPHANLVREERLIAGVNFLGELPPKLRDAVLLIEDKEASGATWEDATTLAKYEGLQPDRERQDNPYNEFVNAAMAG